MNATEKIRAGLYENKLLYPSRSNLQKLRESRWIPKQITASEEQRMIIAYRSETDRLKEEFKADALEEVGVTGNPKANELFRICWDYGRGALGKVMCHLYELAPLIK